MEFLSDQPSLVRIVTPFQKALEKLGIELNYRVVDFSLAKQKFDQFDFDITTRRYSMSLTPGIELRGIFGSDAADAEGSSNIMGVKSPAVDALIKVIEDAKTREELEVAVKTLDRVLRAMHIWVPQWYKPEHNIAYFDMYERPYGMDAPMNGMGEASIWWFNPEKEAALKAAGAIR